MSYSGYMMPATMTNAGYGSSAYASASSFAGGNGQIQQNYSGYRQPVQSGYGGGYPAQQPSYPGNYGGGYPAQQPSYPGNYGGGYAAQQPSYPGNYGGGYPAQQPSYPSNYGGNYGYPQITNHPPQFTGYTQAPPNNYIDNYYHYGITQIPFNYQQNDYFQQFQQPVYNYQQNQYQLPTGQLPGIYNQYPPYQQPSYGSGGGYQQNPYGGSPQGGYGSTANILQQLLQGIGYTG